MPHSIRNKSAAIIRASGKRGRGEPCLNDYLVQRRLMRVAARKKQEKRAEVIAGIIKYKAEQASKIEMELSKK